MDTSSGPSLWFSKRFLVAFVLFLYFMNFQMLRNNVNITVVEMTSNRTIVQGNRTTIRPPEFNWDSITVGLVLCIHAYGGLLSFLGGFLVDWLGGAMNCSLSTLVAGLTTLIQPAALNLDFRLFLACRFVAGIFECFFYVSITDVFARWFPKNERTSLISFSLNGSNVGVAIVYPLCGYLAHTWGWQVVFYVTGGLSVFFSLLCGIMVPNRPSQDKWISKKELEYVLKETESMSTEKINHPYKLILTSGPVWSLCLLMFSYMWISTILGACLPLYIKDLTQKNTNEIGLITFIPNVVFVFSLPLSGTVMTFWENRCEITTTRIHKILVFFACLSSTVALVVIILVPNFVVMISSVVVIQIVTSFMILIVQLAPICLSAESSNVIVGLISVSFSGSIIVSQNATSFMVSNHSPQEWNNCFFLVSGILLLTAVIYAIYGCSEHQQWTAPPSQPGDRRKSLISVQFHNDLHQVPVRGLGLQLRRVSINHSEIQNRVRRLSLKNVDIRSRVQKLSALNLNPRQDEHATSSGSFEFTENEIRPLSIVEYSETSVKETVTGFPIHKIVSEPAFGNLQCLTEERRPRRSSIKNFECFSNQLLGRRTSKSVQFVWEQDPKSNDNSKPSALEETNTIECPEGEHSSSSVSSSQTTSNNSNTLSDNTDSKCKSSLKTSENINDGQRSSMKVVQFNHG